MAKEKNVAQTDNVLKELLTKNEFDGGLCSSDDEFDSRIFESHPPFDDIEEMLIREQILGAKQLFKDITEPGSSEDEEEEEYRAEFFEEHNSRKDDTILKTNSKLSEVIRSFETAMQLNSRMRDWLLMLKGALLRKKQEFEEMINDLDERDDFGCEETQDKEQVMTWGFLGYLNIKEGVVFTNKIGIFNNQFHQPYFKDKKKFCCPLNSDALYWEKRCPVNIISVEASKHWSPQSIDNLVSAIKKVLVEEFKNQADFKALYRWREYSSFVKNHSLAETLQAKAPDYKLDWLKIAALMPSEEGRTGAECSKLWELYLGDKFSKDDWSDEEDDRIIELVNKFDEQDWDKVAEELGTNRSPFQVFSYYQASLRKSRYLGEKWTHEDDEYIRNVVASCTYGDFISWKKVIYYCEKKSYMQIYNRWQNSLTCLKKGKFSEREDRALVTALAHGMGYKDTSKALGGKRSSQQIRNRLMAIVKFGRDNALNVGDWSVKEDSKLLSLVEQHGEKWFMIAKEMETRDRTQCRHRYQRLKKRLTENPNFDIKHMNRRKKKGYKQTLRTRKRNLLKILRKGPMSQRKKKNFLSELNNIMEDPLELIETDIPDQHKDLFKYLGGRGSGFWLPFDQCKVTKVDKERIISVSTLLGAKLNYNKYLEDKTLEEDPHLNSVKEIIPTLKSEKCCEVTTTDAISMCGASTSSDANIQNLVLIPPNQVTCNGFLNALAFCSSNKKMRHKINAQPLVRDSENVRTAKEQFQRRLNQLFLWPAILCNKDNDDKVLTYSNTSSSETHSTRAK